MKTASTVLSATAGVKAIIYLQKLAGIDEPKERALKNWKAMGERDRLQTMMAFATMRAAESIVTKKSVKKGT